MSPVRSPSPLAHSPPRTARHSSSNSGPYISHVENLVLPDGAVGEETAQLLNDLAHPGPHSPLFESSNPDDETLASEEDVETETETDTKQLPWWKRPSPWWLLATTPITAIATSATIAPRIEVYTSLACRVHKPEIFKLSFPNIDHGIFETENVKVAVSVNNYSFPSPILSPLILPGLDTTIAPSDHFIYQNKSQPANPNLCASDPIVQAAVAKLSTAIAASMGFLTCLLTGWWGSYSDRKGRVRVMSISILGLLITDLNFLFVSSFPDLVPGGYWFLVVGPIVEGFLGGLSTAVAANHAYIADTTTENNRSRTFSLALGLLFAGMGFGPSVGAVLIRSTGKVLSVFYFATSVHFAYCLFILTVIPESLTRKKMLLSAAKYAQDSKNSSQDLELKPIVKFLNKFKILFSFLSPLSIFLPAHTESGDLLRKKSRDWSLTLLVISYGFHNLMMGSYTFKFQYAAATFGWTSEIIGYWLSLIGVVRASFLMIILPLIIKLFKPKPVIIETSAELTETHPLLSTDSPSTRRSNTVVKKEPHSSTFDLGLANASLVLELTFYTFLAFATTAGSFTIFSLLVSFGGGYSPAIQSVALSLYTRQGGTESGRLFGALSVASSLGSGILGPALYGTVYMKTVATFPRMIFYISVANTAVALLCASMIYLPKNTSHIDIEDYGGSGRRVIREDTLVNPAE